MSDFVRNTVSTSQRPIPMQMRVDLTAEPAVFQGEPCWIIKDSVSLQYTRLQPEQYLVLKMLDGRHSLNQIRDRLRHDFPAFRCDAGFVQSLIGDLHQRSLVYSLRMGQGLRLLKQHTRQQRRRFLAQVRNPLYIKLRGWDPETTLTRLLPAFGLVFHPAVITLVMLFVVLSWMLLAVNFDAFQARLPAAGQFFGWPNLIYLWLAMTATKIIHEFGHGLSCKYYGGECHDMGIMLLVFTPCLYCDVSDSWLLPSKWQRIMIGAAGMYVEILISALTIWIWLFTVEGFVSNLCLNIFFVTTITTVIFNANPLMRFDGYYILSDLLEIPNLKQQADGMLWRSFAKTCFGISLPDDPFAPQRKRIWFQVYAIASNLYKYLVMFGITISLYTMLKPFDLQSVGVVLAVFSIVTLVWNFGQQSFRIFQSAGSSRMSFFRLTATLTVFGTLVAACVLIPTQFHFDSAAFVEPAGVRHIHTPVAGELIECHVQPGQTVRAGDPIITLENDLMQDQHRELIARSRKIETEVLTQHALEEFTQETLAQARLDAVREQIQLLNRQMEQLVLRAPVAGVVIEPPVVQANIGNDPQARLPKWAGTLLQPENIGTWIDRSTRVASIAPNDRFEAILIVEQSHRRDLQTGQIVTLKFDHVPGRTYDGQITRIAYRQIDFVPATMSNKTGGQLPTVTDSQSRERLTGAAYQAIVEFSGDETLHRSGLRGQARIRGRTTTFARWAWTELASLFRFRL